MNRTLLLIKPKGIERALIGNIIMLLENRGFSIIQMKIVQPTTVLVREHYAEHVDKPIFPKMMNMMMNGRIAAFVLEINNEFGTPAFQTLRNMLGHYDPDIATPGTIRYQFGNFTHGSDSVQAAEREIKLWFGNL
jgi:nucleoside-diphosphate kinase